MKSHYKPWYLSWAAMFVLTAVLGFLFPSVAEPGPRLALMATAGAFFLPPWVILAKARKAQHRKHVLVIRYLSLLSLVSTVALLCANILSVGMGEALGNGLNAALTIVSAPLVCSNFYLMPLFLWATLLMGSLGKD